jgi:hypothetical protein
MQGRTGFVILAAFLGATGGLALSHVAFSQTVFAQEKAAGKKSSGAPKAKPEEKKGAEDGPPSKDSAEPEFKNAKAKESFQKARELFDLEQYKEAKAEFSKAKSDAKTADDRSIVEGWVKASDGGSGLASYQKLAEKGVLRKAFLMAMDLGEQCRGTAIYPKFTAFTDELRPKVATVLDDFDAVDNRHSKKYGKEFVSEPDKVFRGSNSLLWTNTKDPQISQLQVKTIPKKWGSEYHSVVFWVRMDGYPVVLKLMTLSPGAGTKGQETPVMECDWTPQGKSGWQRAEVELSQLKKRGAGTLNNVEKLILQIDSKSAFKVYVDDILLTRNDPAEKKAADAEPKDDSKKKSTTKAGKVKQTERKSG